MQVSACLPKPIGKRILRLSRNTVINYDVSAGRPDSESPRSLLARARKAKGKIESNVCFVWTFFLFPLFDFLVD